MNGEIEEAEEMQRSIEELLDSKFAFTNPISRKERYYYYYGKIAQERNLYYQFTNIGSSSTRSHGIQKNYYENGDLALEEYFNQGQRDGKITAWYENGQVKGYNYYKNTLPTGTWQEWDENGQLIKESTFSEMIVPSLIREGESGTLFKSTSKSWYGNNQLKEITKAEYSIIFYRELRVGDYKAYYSNGQIKEEGQYDNSILNESLAELKLSLNESFRRTVRKNKGIKHGKWKYYNENGDLLVEQKWKFGQLKKEKKYADELVIFDYFNPPAEEHCRLNLSLRVELSDTIYEEKNYCVNRREMFWTDTFYNHIVNDLGDTSHYIFEIVDFLNKQGHLNYKRYYPNGQIMADYTYGGRDYEIFEPLKEGWTSSCSTIRTGTATFWYDNGQVQWIEEKEEIMERFTISVKKTEFYRSGQMKSITYSFIYGDGQNTWKKWYENGQLKEQIGHNGSDKEGEYLKWNEKGILLKKLNYKEDELDGEQFYYDEKGELIETEIYKSGILVEILLNNK